MQRIPLSQNQVAIVDDADFPLLSEFRWCFRGERDGAQGYAVRHHKVSGKDRLLYLHREVMAPIPAGHEVIFRNGDKLDCRRENLRVVTTKEARQHHQRARSNSQSGIKGITYNPRPRTWSVDIYRDGQAKRVGTFDRLKDAKDALEQRLRLENPDLHTAPARVERTGMAAAERRGNADSAEVVERG